MAPFVFRRCRVKTLLFSIALASTCVQALYASGHDYPTIRSGVAYARAAIV